MHVEPYLEDLERRIEPQVEDALLREWIDFADGRFRGQVFSPRRPRLDPPAIDWPAPTVNAAQDGFDAMLIQQLRLGSQALETGKGALLAARCNYGTAILPSLFGAELFVMDAAMDTLQTTRPFRGGGADAMRQLLDQGVPDLRAGLGSKVFDMAQRFAALACTYPKIGRYLWIYHPDIQGSMDATELLWGSDLFLDLVDQPELVHRVLDRVTTVYEAFLREWQRIIPPRQGYAVHWAMLHRGQVMIRNDSAMNLSPDMFDEFVRPYDQRVLDAFGGGAIHFCGRGDHYIARTAQLRGLSAFNLTQPHLNDMETIFRHSVDRGLNLLELAPSAVQAAQKEGRDLCGRVHSW
jgi:hypothetical protein